jgi:hypothetical protein
MTIAELTVVAVALIQEIVAAVKDAQEGKVTPDAAHQRILALRSQLAAHDAAADAALAARFDDEEEEEP